MRSYVSANLYSLWNVREITDSDFINIADYYPVKQILSLIQYSFPVSWSAPFEVDITPYVKEGQNTLSIEIVNLWPNRLIGDSKLPKQERRTKTNIVKFDAPDSEKYLRTSGLLGPVKIRSFKQVKIEDL